MAFVPRKFTDFYMGSNRSKEQKDCARVADVRKGSVILDLSLPAAAGRLSLWTDRNVMAKLQVLLACRAELTVSKYFFFWQQVPRPC